MHGTKHTVSARLTEVPSTLKGAAKELERLCEASPALSQERLASLTDEIALISRETSCLLLGVPEAMTIGDAIDGALNRQRRRWNVHREVAEIVIPELLRYVRGVHREHPNFANDRCPAPLVGVRDVLLEALKKLPPPQAHRAVHLQRYGGKVTYVNHRNEPWHIEINLEPWRQGRITTTVKTRPLHASATEEKRMIAAALERVLAIVCEPAPHETDELIDTLCHAQWERMLSALERVAPKDRAGGAQEKAAPELYWVVDPTGLFLRIEPMTRRIKKSGRGFTKLRRASASTAMKLCREDPKQRAVAEIFMVMTDWGHGASAKCEALRAMVGLPNVLSSAEAEQRMDVRETRFVLEITAVEGGYRLGVGFHAGGEVIDLNACAEDDDVPMYQDKDRRVLWFAPFDARLELIWQAVKRGEVVPSEGAAQLLHVVDRLQPLCDVVLPPALAGEEVQGDPTPVLRLNPLATGGIDVQVGVRPLEQSPLLPVGEGDPRISAVLDDRRVIAVRDLEKEQARLRRLLEVVALDDVERRGGRYVVDVPDDALDLLGALRTAAEAQPDIARVEWPREGAIQVLGAVGPQALRLKVQAARDWFAVEGGAVDEHLEGAFGVKALALDTLMQAFHQGRRYVEVGTHRFVRLEEQLRAQLETLSEVLHDDVGRSAKGKASVGPAGAAALRSLEEHGAIIEADGAFEDALARLKKADALTPRVPRGLQADLRPYQREGYVWACRLAEWGLGGVLADDMGLGKTLQAIAVMLRRKAGGPAIVVAPTSVVGNWERELQRFAPRLTVVRYDGQGANATKRQALLDELGPESVLLLSYGLVVNDIDALASITFHTAIFDEVHAAKNATTARAKALRQLNAEWRLGLSGTPVENDVSELWAVFRLVNPGLFGSWEAFKRKHRGNAKTSTGRRRLANQVRPFLLRRTKREVAPELPARTDKVLVVEPSQQEREHYAAFRALVVEALSADGDDSDSGDNKGRLEVLAGLTKLRLLACHPRLVDEHSPLPSAKQRALLRLVDDLRQAGHRALVFSQFVKHLSLVRRALDDAEVPYLYLDGSTPARERQRLTEAFQDGEGDLFLISLKAGGTGLNLTAADFVIHLDPWWNPAVEDQATDRAHRIGQHRPVTVYRLVTAGTVEEKIIELHADKRELVDDLLAGADGGGKLSVDELVALLRGDGCGG